MLHHTNKLDPEMSYWVRLHDSPELHRGVKGKNIKFESMAGNTKEGLGTSQRGEVKWVERNRAKG